MILSKSELKLSANTKGRFTIPSTTLNALRESNIVADYVVVYETNVPGLIAFEFTEENIENSYKVSRSLKDTYLSIKKLRTMYPEIKDGHDYFAKIEDGYLFINVLTNKKIVNKKINNKSLKLSSIERINKKGHEWSRMFKVNRTNKKHEYKIDFSEAIFIKMDLKTYSHLNMKITQTEGELKVYFKPNNDGIGAKINHYKKTCSIKRILDASRIDDLFKDSNTILFEDLNRATFEDFEYFQKTELVKKVTLSSEDFFRSPQAKEPCVYQFKLNGKDQRIGLTSKGAFFRHEQEYKNMFDFDQVDLFLIDDLAKQEKLEAKLLNEHKEKHGRLPTFNKIHGKRAA